MRIPKPFYRKQTKSWYVQIGAKQINLGRDEDKAKEKYHELMAGRQEPSPKLKVSELIDKFLVWSKANRAPGTFKWYEKYLKPFKVYVKGLKVADAKPYNVTEWQATFNGDANRNCAVRAAKRLFRWAVDEGIIDRSPVASCKPPRVHPREVYITREQWKQFIGLIKPGPFLDAVLFMRYTGCRPQELCAINAEHVEGNCIVLKRTESKGKRSRRVIPLTTKAKAIIDKLLKVHPSRALFRTTRGKRWTSDCLNSRFDDYEDKLDFKIFSYVIRHAFVTDCLEAGMDPIKLAEIVGHRDLKMIMTVYQHLNLKRDHLRDELEKFTDAA
jgi:integrase